VNGSQSLGRTLTLVALLAIATEGGAHAVDGVVEINQTRALAGGVTPSDAPGFPVTLDRPGSYRLTGSLDVSGQPAPQSVTAILVSSSFVTLDLNGFSLVGPTTCTGSPVSACAPVGSGLGIDSLAANFVRITNGIVRGFGNSGVLVGNGTLENLQTFGNGGSGMVIMAGGAVTRCAAIGNRYWGIDGDGIIVESSRALENGNRGIEVGSGEVRHCEAVHNQNQGIVIGAGLALGNLSRANGLSALLATTGGGYAANVLSGTTPITGGTALGVNVCNGAPCP